MVEGLHVDDVNGRLALQPLVGLVHNGNKALGLVTRWYEIDGAYIKIAALFEVVSRVRDLP